MAAREAVVTAVLEGRQAFVGILGGLLQGIAAWRKTPFAAQRQLSLEGRDRIAVADLFGLGGLAFVEQKQRDGELVAGVAELAGSWPGDPTQTQALGIGFQGDVWAGIRAIDRDLDGLPLGRAAPELFLGSIGRSAVIPPGDGGLQGGALLQDEAQTQGGGKPTAAGVGLVEGIVGIVVLLLFLQPVGGAVAGFFARKIGEGELFLLGGAAGLLLEHMGHQETRGVPDGGGLGQVLMTTGHVVPAGTDQIAVQRID